MISQFFLANLLESERFVFCFTQNGEYSLCSLILHCETSSDLLQKAGTTQNGPDAKVLFRMISVQFSMESASSSRIKNSPERDMYVLVKPCITFICSESSYASSLGETVLRVRVKP